MRALDSSARRTLHPFVIEKTEVGPRPSQEVIVHFEPNEKALDAVSGGDKRHD